MDILPILSKEEENAMLPEILRIPTRGATGKLGPLLGSQSS